MPSKTEVPKFKIHFHLRKSVISLFLDFFFGLPAESLSNFLFLFEDVVAPEIIQFWKKIHLDIDWLHAESKRINITNALKI